MKIKLLDDALINKIAAGEVVERPASVVKELVENSIDAEATTITVELEEGGKSVIRVTDNGSGMNKEDTLLCLERHATSKISTTDDLFNINTLGFRGEALASIAAVSQLSLKTKTKDNIVGIKVLCSGGKIFETGEVAIPNGTIIEVSDLFFNIPARKKHLKTMQTELRQITEVMTKFALAYPEKTFKLMHHTQEILFSPAAKPIDTIILLYGKKISVAMIPIQYTYNEIEVTGFISKPTLTRNDKGIQHIFINTRCVKNNIITKAVYDAYHTLLHLENHPLFIIHVTINPSIIDVNVHPQKAVIRVEKENELYTALFNAVRHALDTAQLMPVMTDEKTPTIQTPLIQNINNKFTVTNENQSSIKPESIEIKPQELLEKALKKVKAGEVNPNEEEKKESKITVIFEKKSTFITPITTEPVTVPADKTDNRISTLKLIGRIHNVFYIAENELGLVIIDQHAAHERVLYEKFMQQYFDNSIHTQELLIPEEIEFSPTEMLLLTDNIKTIEKLGFHFDEFGRNTMLMRTIPSILGKFLPKESIHEILSQLDEKTVIDFAKEEKLIRNACRSAVKAHDIVHTQEMSSILQELQKCKQPFTCPHGRPTMIQFTIPELEKKFKRIV
ncbi:MAG: DNA mismatch repair endonuclease MutL [Candidatus Woesearchaeota archaeon]|jgi:DNA mismatch repair protein MutL